jgi:hypothetical protein
MRVQRVHQVNKAQSSEVCTRMDMGGPAVVHVGMNTGKDGEPSVKAPEGSLALTAGRLGR